MLMLRLVLIFVIKVCRWFHCYSNSNYIDGNFFCPKACFTSDHQTLPSILGQTCHECINHDTVVGLCSELLMRLSYYIHRSYGKNASTLAGIELGTSWSQVVCLNRSTKALIQYYLGPCYKSYYSESMDKWL